VTTVSRLLALCTGAFLTSCVEVDKQEYPNYWPARVVNAEGCTPVSGTFQNRSIDDSMPLATWFVSSTDSLATVDRLDFPSETSGAFRFRFLSADGGVLLDRTWHEGQEYRCAHGAMEWHGKTFKFIGLASNDLVQLQRNARGDIVIREAGTSGGIVLVVPMYISGRSWYAYRRVAE
jgi:hypothetical protein